MNICQLSEPQREALLDLAMLAMYADGHLASAEDQRILGLLKQMGHSSDYDCARHYDAAAARVRQHCQTSETAGARAKVLAAQFSTAAEQQLVAQLLEDLASSDGTVAARESGFLAVVKKALDR